MTSLWPLVRDELSRLLPELTGWSRRLALGSDPTALAQWQRRLESFKGALVVFANAALSDLINQLTTIWNANGDRENAGQRAQQAIDWLTGLTALEVEPAQARLAELPEFLNHWESTAVAVVPTLDPRLAALFATEIEDKTAAMDRLLLQLEQAPDRLELIAPLMRAAHSIKGAARAVKNEAVVALAHQLEDRLSAAQNRAEAVPEDTIDQALRTVDRLRALSRDATAADTSLLPDAELQRKRASEGVLPVGEAQVRKAKRDRRSKGAAAEATSAAPPGDDSVVPSTYIDARDADPILRVKASHIGRVIALAGSGMVESRRLKSFAERQQRLRRQLGDAARGLDALHHRLGAPAATTALGAELSTIREQLADTRHHVNDWMEDFGEYMRESFDLTERIYHSASQTRLRPFGDVAGGYPRMVRDLARRMGKKVHVEIVGEQLAVDRDVIEQIDAPLTHLLRNAMDHGIEMPEVRRAAGKSEDGTIRIGASYRAGMLSIDITDNGAGIDYEAIRRKLVESGRLDPASGADLDAEALHDYLFSAGFSTRDEISEISGRGVGLDVVRQMVKQLDGNVRVSSTLGQGATFHLLVPISRAVTRALVVRVAGEAYAFPLLRIEGVVRASGAAVRSAEGLHYLHHEGRNIGLVPLAEQLELGESRLDPAQVDAVIIVQEGRSVAFLIEAVIGEYDLATRPLDPRLGRVADVAALAVLPDGVPVVLLDVDDLMRGALEEQRARLTAKKSDSREDGRRRRILVIDDSISVRELERQVLTAHGYEVAVAVDGMDGWTRLREWPCDLVVTDVDMPRMDGIELTRSIKQDPKLRSLPVVIVSYRDRPEDRARGLEVRADAYLTKSDFQEDGFLEVVHGLIGDA